MQKIDPGFLYSLGGLLRPLVSLSADAEWYVTLPTLMNARDAVVYAVHPNNIYSAALRQSQAQADTLFNVLDATIKRAEAPGWNQQFSAQELQAVQDAYVSFEGAYITEMRNAVIYYVKPHSGFDVEELIERGAVIFPASLSDRVPEAVRDVQEGAKALAFRLWTASGYHFHRANEAVLRRYFDLVAAGAIERDPKWAMGKLIEKLKEKKLGKRPILAALNNIVEFHRNPLIHPQDFINDSDEAISLYTAIRSAMGYMLDELPAVEPPPLIHVTRAPEALPGA